MRIFAGALPLFLLMAFAIPVFAQESQQQDIIVDKMAFKFTRGLANTATCIMELPKQIILTSRERGSGIGLVIGPFKGLGMTAYRAFAGVVETVFFMVPQPGYYDSMINPDFVWNGWERVGSDIRTAESMDGSGGTRGE